MYLTKILFFFSMIVGLTSSALAEGENRVETGKFDGTLKLGKEISSISHVLHGSGEVVTYYFSMNSDISKKIIAVCQDNSKCEFTGKVRRINEELKGIDEANEIISVSQVNLGKVKNVYLPGELVSENSMEDIYFAAEKPPITNAPSEAPLCHKFQVANLEEQLSKLKTKYVNLYDEKIIQNADGSRSLMAKKKDESGKEFQYFYTTSSTVCSEYQKTHLVGDERNTINIVTSTGWSFPLLGKNITLGMTLAEVKLLFPEINKSEKNNTDECKNNLRIRRGVCTVFEYQKQNEADRFILVFIDNRLDEFQLNGGTEGLTDTQKAFDTLMVKKYGNGKINRKGPDETTRWSVQGAIVQKDYYSGAESGDVTCSYTISLKK